MKKDVFEKRPYFWLIVGNYRNRQCFLTRASLAIVVALSNLTVFVVNSVITLSCLAMVFF